ncbi:MAG: hypothetical protein DRN20_05000 [Thermoplasmata archaeon]|nr:MAG: hypothetical protein DRN20_05000 [Thermoplasmata archaeon]
MSKEIKYQGCVIRPCTCGKRSRGKYSIRVDCDDLRDMPCPLTPHRGTIEDAKRFIDLVYLTALDDVETHKKPDVGQALYVIVLPEGDK